MQVPENRMDKSQILIVDDNPRNIQLLGSVLKEQGYFVEYALNGQDALNWAEVKEFDLILLDIMMPEMDGFEVCRKFKDNKANADIPVIFLTSKTEPESIVKGFEQGAVDYISKPFEKKELLARVQTHLTLRKIQRELFIKNKKLVDSINYAYRIQKSMLPPGEKLAKLLGDYFLFYLPRDIVSGDFFWIEKFGHLTVLAVADGTGHGVPGAFMSMLGMSLMYEIIPRSDLKDPGDILNQMRSRIKTNLQQSGKIEEAQDGMDMALCIFDREKMHLNFSGAFNAVYIVRDQQLHVIKGDPQPIGIYYHENKFSNHRFDLLKGDAVYLFSDGFPDQFGGESNRKFLTRNFKKLLTEISHLPMEEQHEILIDRFSTWKGEYDQVDDLTVLGFRI
jgi:CheY-like chemotaxis protein